MMGFAFSLQEKEAGKKRSDKRFSVMINPRKSFLVFLLYGQLRNRR